MGLSINSHEHFKIWQELLEEIKLDNSIDRSGGD
jgi:hypothetical protein